MDTNGSILDGIIAQGVSERKTDTGTDFAVSKFGHALPFRGLLKDVRNTSNGQLLETASLAWKVHTMPVGVIGKTETRVADNYQALVRGDTGGILSITSDRFKAHQNSDIMNEMIAMAEAGDAEVCFAGSLDEGRKVVAIAKMNGEFTLPDVNQRTHINNHSGDVRGMDKTHLFVVISGGHEIGTPFKIRGMAFRLWCMNGAFFTAMASSTYTRSHRMPMSRVQAQVKHCYESIAAEFGTYKLQAAKLQSIKAEKEQQRLYVAELLKPGLAKELGVKLATASGALAESQVWTEVADSLRGCMALDQMIVDNDQSMGFARTGKHLLDAIVEQDGANGDNLWSTYNGITWYVDHKRGRNPESGMDAALFGAGADLKERALTTALKFS